MQIGDKLYRYVSLSGIWEFEVIGIRNYKDGEYFELRCNDCKHGWKCEVLITKDDYNRYKYIKMLNNDGEDDQRYWHNDPHYEFYFHETKDNAKAEFYKILIKEKKRAIEDIEKRLTRERKELKKYVEFVEIASK